VDAEKLGSRSGSSFRPYLREDGGRIDDAVRLHVRKHVTSGDQRMYVLGHGCSLTDRSGDVSIRSQEPKGFGFIQPGRRRRSQSATLPGEFAFQT